MSEHQRNLEPQPRDGDQAPRSLASFSGLHAVVVARTARSRHALAGLLRQLDILVVSLALDASEAIKQARSHRPDLMLIDLDAPLADGLEAMRVIVAEAPGTNVVFVVDRKPAALKRRAQIAGVVGRDVTPAQLGTVLAGLGAPTGSLARSVPTTPASGESGSIARPRAALSWEEEDVLTAFAAGRSRAEVARSLGISLEEVDRHVANVFATLHRLHRRGPSLQPQAPEPRP